MPKQVFFTFLRFICDDLEFPSVKSSKLSQHIASCEIRVLNTKKVGFGKAGFSIMLCIFLIRKKNWSYRFPWKTTSDYSKTITTSLPSFTEFHRRKREKSICQFCYLCSCWHNNISQNTDVFLRACADYLSLCPQRACDRKTIRSHLKKRCL